MTKARRALDDAINGDQEHFDGNPQGRAALRALRSLATHVDDINHKIDKLSTRLTTIATTVGTGIVGAAILAALRLT